VTRKPRPAKRVGRKRRTLGISLLALAAATITASAASGFYWVEWHAPLSDWSLWGGRINVYAYDVPAARRFVRNSAPNKPGLWSGKRTDDGIHWLFWWGWEHQQLTAGDPQTGGVAIDDRNLGFFGVASMQRGGVTINTSNVILWPPGLIAALGGVILYTCGRRARSRAIVGACRACGYDLTATPPGSPCPECGKPQATAA
jgi:hypothetical protein